MNEGAPRGEFPQDEHQETHEVPTKEKEVMEKFRRAHEEASNQLKENLGLSDEEIQKRIKQVTEKVEQEK